MKVLVVAGARPNFMKVAPIIHALRDAGHTHVLVHTGQHYDQAMSDSFFRDLEIPEPDAHLGVGSGTHAQQTASVMQRFEPVLIEQHPDWVVVVGDVNSTLACALVAAKLRYEHRFKIAHVEAGLRSNDWRMPEEVNRVLTDHCADLLLTPSPDAEVNLAREGLSGERIVFVGNVMIDSLLHRLPAAQQLNSPARYDVEAGKYALVTLHRPSNVDDAATLGAIAEALDKVSERMPVLFPVHPRTARNIENFGLKAHFQRVRMAEPLGYLEMIGLTASARIVLTDSGGLQEETTALGVPCLTLREQTERPITITEGTNRLTEWPPRAATIIAEVGEILDSGNSSAHKRPEGWDGEAAVRIVAALDQHNL